MKPQESEQPTDEEMRIAIMDSLRKLGFVIENDSRLRLPSDGKDQIRELNMLAMAHKRNRSRPALGRREEKLLKKLASGKEVKVDAISPMLVEVISGSEDELLFRYATLHWSIPVSSGYGRRLRFLIIDQHNGKLMGVIGLGDPVFNLGPRDHWIGWGKTAARDRLRYVMDLFVLGAVPPYSFLLCGKLAGLLATSNEVRAAMSQKYSGQGALISGNPHDGSLALLTTTSALGRSSMYNRLKYHGQTAFIKVGSTRGYGEFQFSDGIYDTLSEYASANLLPSGKHHAWGKGFRNRREVVRKVLDKVELSKQLLNHGIKREVFAVPLAENCREFLHGQEDFLVNYNRPVNAIFSYFRERWLIPRSQRDHRYTEWRPDEWRIWGNG